MNKLKAVEIKNAPAGSKLGDGGGLRFVHDKSGRKFWEMRFQMNGKGYTLGCGGAGTTLAQARAARDDARTLIRQGINPVIANRTAKVTTGSAQLTSDSTLQEMGNAYVKAKSGEWSNEKHSKQWLRPLEIHAVTLMATPMSAIDINSILSVLEPIWATKTETAKRMQQRLSRIFAFAKVRGLYAADNPAAWKGYLEEALASPSKIRPVQHFAAMPYPTLPSFWTYMGKSESASADCLRFLILTAARSGEARGATWEEVDLTAKVWTVPAERMKGRKEHTVPLTPAAIKVLKQRLKLREVTGNSALIFPGERKGNILSDVAVTKTLRRYGGKYTIHGMRSAFRDWAAEQKNHDDLAAEMSLAHQDRDKVRAAYLRSDLFDKRRALMNQWAKFVISGKGNVIKMDKAS